MTQEQLDRIRWLNRAFHAEKAAKALLAKLERDRSLAERISRGLSSGSGSCSQTSIAAPSSFPLCNVFSSASESTISPRVILMKIAFSCIRSKQC